MNHDEQTIYFNCYTFNVTVLRIEWKNLHDVAFVVEMY